MATITTGTIATFTWVYQVNSPAAVNRIFTTTATGTDMNSNTAVSTNVVTKTVPVQAAIVPRWSYPAAAVSGGFNAVPTSHDNVIIAGANNNKVYALDTVNGALKWTYSTSGIITSPIITIWDEALGSYLVVVTSQDNKIYCLIDNGTSVSLRWSRDYSTAPAAAFKCGATTDGTYVYVGGDDAFVRCLDLVDGTDRAGWVQTNIGQITTTAVVQNGFVMVGSAGTNRIYRLNPDGTIHSSYLTGAAVYSSPFLWNSRLYVVSDKLYCLNASNMTTPYWSYGIGATTSQSSPWFDFDTSMGSGPVIFGTEDSKVHAVKDNGTTGTLFWGAPYATTGAVRTNPIRSYNGPIFFGDNSGKVYSLNAADGTLRSGWPYTTGGAIKSSPALDEDGAIMFIGSSDGKLYSFDVSQ